MQVISFLSKSKHLLINILNTSYKTLVIKDPTPNYVFLFRSIPKTNIDVVLVDGNLPGFSGIDCVAILKKTCPNILFLMCTSFEDDDKIFKSHEAGASGYILKTEGPTRIIGALEDLFEGGSPISSSIARKVVASFSKFGSQQANVEVLTARDNEILELLSTGKMNKEVADALQISTGTVRKHIQNIYEKLHVNTRVVAVNIYHKRYSNMKTTCIFFLLFYVNFIF
jgi:NarL family two-component system response regulator LiaR